jgi:lipid A 3-O-deacylase
MLRQPASAAPSNAMTTTTIFLRLCAAGALATAACLAHAVDWRPDAVVLQAGLGRSGNALIGAGLSWDWSWHYSSAAAELSARTELLLNEWRADDFGGGHQSFTQLVLLPTLRMQVAQGRSPWFLELGIGASYMDPLYVTPEKQFSTRFNFYDVLGVGYSLGRDRELGLRLNHVSNGGIKKPNPGEEFVQLRFLQRF